MAKYKKVKKKTFKEIITSDSNITKFIYVAISYPIISFFIYITNKYKIPFYQFLLTLEAFMVCGLLCGLSFYYVLNKNVSAKFWIISSLLIIFTFSIVAGIAKELTTSTGINYLKYIIIQNE